MLFRSVAEERQDTAAPRAEERRGAQLDLAEQLEGHRGRRVVAAHDAGIPSPGLHQLHEAAQELVRGQRQRGEL